MNNEHKDPRDYFSLKEGDHGYYNDTNPYELLSQFDELTVGHYYAGD